MDSKNKALQEFLDLTGLTTPDGKLERPVAPVHLLVPAECDLQGDRIVWSAGFMHTAPERPVRVPRALLKDYRRFASFQRAKKSKAPVSPRKTRKAPGPGLLTEFIALADASDQDVLAYVRRWGPLCICKHGFPCSHHREECGPLRVDQKPPLRQIFWEPVASWRYFAEQALAMVVLAGLCHERRVDDQRLAGTLYGRPPSPLPPRPSSPTQQARRRERDWKWEQETKTWMSMMGRWMDEQQPGWRNPPLRDRLMYQRREVAGALNRWIELGAIRPMVLWETSDPSFDITAGTFGHHAAFNDNLFGALAMELTYAVLRRLRLRRCDGCGRPHSPRRWPQPTQHSFCRDCGKRAAWRLSKRRARSGAKT